jgi:alcohol dehydrogenase
MILSKNYEFFCPVKICSGNKALEHLPFELGLLGATKPLVVTNTELVGNRQLKNVIRAFKDSAITFGMVTDIPAEADLQTVHDIAGIYRAKKCDALIAVGGGSVGEIAKVVNLAVSTQVDDLKILTEADVIKERLNPFVAVLTSAGTGLETTKWATIAGLTFASPFLMPNLALIDPRMMKVEPVRTTLTMAVTALAYAIEAYTCPAKNPLTDMYAYPAIQLIIANLVNVLQHPGDKSGRLALVNAACMAGCASSTFPSQEPVLSVSKEGQGVGFHSWEPVLSLSKEGQKVGPLDLLHQLAQYEPDRHGYATADLLLPLTNPGVYAGTPDDQKASQALNVLRNFLMEISVTMKNEE